MKEEFGEHEEKNMFAQKTKRMRKGQKNVYQFSPNL